MPRGRDPDFRLHTRDGVTNAISTKDIEAGEWRARATPAGIKASITSLVSRGIPVMLCGNRDGCERFTGGLLWRRWIHEYKRVRQLAKGINQ
ncbi:MAG: hypothetical protein ABGZ35_03575 [Planctomycetaceae bacterium]